ncbi:hypothetical protein Pd630_LPD03603 [Rhodococcus opacus PD630]|nr:hypothetical protein Pd630_LPD03603 [Rhodococcus opacus PD630]
MDGGRSGWPSFETDTDDEKRSVWIDPRPQRDIEGCAERATWRSHLQLASATTDLNPR